jgi:methionine-rich copper-binding protein CopC
LKEAPEVLELGFSTDVQLLKLDIADDAGTAQVVDFRPAPAAARNFSIPLPALAPGAYAVTWTIVGADGHRVEGNLSFLVDATAHEPADTEGAKDGE